MISVVIPTLNADVCSGFHVYAYEWTADYIAWFFDGTEIRALPLSVSP